MTDDSLKSSVTTGSMSEVAREVQLMIDDWDAVEEAGKVVLKNWEGEGGEGQITSSYCTTTFPIAPSHPFCIRGSD